MRLVIPLVLSLAGFGLAGDVNQLRPGDTVRGGTVVSVERDAAGNVIRYTLAGPSVRVERQTVTREYLESAPVVTAPPPVRSVTRYAVKEVAVPVPEVHYVPVRTKAYVPVAAVPLRYGDYLGAGRYNTATGNPPPPRIIPGNGPVRGGLRLLFGYDPYDR